MATVNEGNGLQISLAAKARRRFLSQYLRGERVTVVEIGALDNPTFLPEEDEVYFADYFSQEESQRRHQNGRRRTADRIVAVDFVLRDASLRETVNVRPDLVIANHVIEHVPDMIRWLQDVRAIMAEGGRLFLSVPDRRFTFDYFKPDTDAVDVLRAYDERLVRPSKYQIMRHLYYHADINRNDAWEGRYPADHMHRISFSDAIDRANALSGEYTDVHCSVFSMASFTRLFADLADTGLVPWTITHMADVDPNDNEFRVLLQAV